MASARGSSVAPAWSSLWEAAMESELCSVALMRLRRHEVSAMVWTSWRSTGAVSLLETCREAGGNFQRPSSEFCWLGEREPLPSQSNRMHVALARASAAWLRLAGQRFLRPDTGRPLTP